MMKIRLAAIAAMLFLAVISPASARDPGPFYAASAAEAAGAPGTLIRQEPLLGAPVGASAYRVLYRSTGLKGEPIAVSGVVMVPASPAPPGGRPILAWAHPTSGIVPPCAPSLARSLFTQIDGLDIFLARGYVIAATDYPGLGAGGPHPYLVGVSEGRAVLDIARAARQVPYADAGNKVALWGHSQGGQAVLYAADLARHYAPGLDIVGVAAAAPATELGALMRDDIATSGGKNLLAMTLWSWARVFGAPIGDVVAPAAMPVVDHLASICLESLIDIEPRLKAGAELQKNFLKVDDITALEPWKRLMAENTIGALPPAIPVFLAQGLKDKTVDPPVTFAYAGRLCAGGSRVEVLKLPSSGHAFAGRNSARAAAAWIADRLAGKPAPSTCP